MHVVLIETCIARATLPLSLCKHGTDSKLVTAAERITQIGGGNWKVARQNKY
jgi:hypothetical protein